MNIKILDSWLREFLETSASSEDIMRCLSLCGPSVERISGSGNDTIYDIEITTNRIDTVSVEGIAREAAAILPRFGIRAVFHPKPDLPIKSTDGELPVEIRDDSKLCKRVLALAMDNVSVTPSNPLMAQRLEKSGIRALNNLVDITNYVMLELGHPCHVFDYDRINTGKLVLRTARKGEKMGETLKTLDGKTYSLYSDDVIIDDGTGRIIDLPGIMGTENSVVTKDTSRILVFIESNDPVRIRKTSLRYGIRTLAATINEKNPDISLAGKAFRQAIRYYMELAGARPASRLVDIINSPPGNIRVNVTASFISDRMGIQISEKEICSILKSLGFGINRKGGILEIQPPDFRRNDIRIPEDIVEEVARIYGYQNLPSRLMSGELPANNPDKNLELETEVKIRLRDWGYSELYNYSLVSGQMLEKAGISSTLALKLENPLNLEFEYLRPSLVPSILDSAAKNSGRSERLRLFELSKVYLPKEESLPQEQNRLAILDSGGFYSLKGIVESLIDVWSLTGLDTSTDYRGADFHPGKYLLYSKEGIRFIEIGAVHPKLLSEFRLDGEVYLALLDIDVIAGMANHNRKYIPVSQFPEVYEDITVTVPLNLKAGELMEGLASADPLVKKVELKEKFRDSLTFRITFHNPDRNIDSKDLPPVRERIGSILTKFNTGLKGK